MSGDHRVDYRTEPARYKHWKLSFDGAVATLAMDVAQDGGIREGYALKLNSYDLGVDIELHDAIQRVRFEHPEVGCVVLTSAKDRVFCSGANIFMLGLSTHAWKVNFCKFTNETRNGLEDSSRHDGLSFLAAVNGACAGGGYELALACDLRVAGESAKFGQPETGLGILAAAGATWRLAALVGLGRARELLFTGRIFEADEALHMGMVNQIVPDGEVLDAALAIAAMISANDPLATRMTKLALAQYEGDTAAMMRFANATQAALFENPEKFRRMDAFLARRKK